MRLHRSPRGFTLIELLVVMAIIAMLLALLIPAIQRAPRSRPASQCGNNSNQIQTAIMQFVTAKDRLPYLVTTLPGKTPVTGSTNYVDGRLGPADSGQPRPRRPLSDLHQQRLGRRIISNATGTSAGPPGNAFIQYLDLYSARATRPN